MRYLILTDIHANWHALETVLADAAGQYDQIICCGDLVGYNPHPDRVAAWVQQNSHLVVRGNHDKVVCGLEPLDWFNEIAGMAARWTSQVMHPENLDYLKSLPEGPAALNGFQICHGSPRDEDEYVTNQMEAAPCFQVLDGDLLFFGHTHIQGGFLSFRNKVMLVPAVKKTETEMSFQLQVDAQYMLNPGSVGQPRDGDPRAAYAIYDSTEKVVFLRRVKYPVMKTVADIREAGLPDVLGVRLLHGL